jgi:probable rRNA maturation factor
VTRPRRRATLTVAVTDARGRRVPDGGLGRWLASAAPRTARGAITIALISDAAMRRLNATYRDKDYATDVLSFPASDKSPRGRVSAGSSRRAGSQGAHLGDLAIAQGVAGRQARQFGHALRTEHRILALHGLLHLLGYDHETDSGTMRRLEDRLRRRAGLPAGLVTRAHRGPALSGTAR